MPRIFWSSWFVPPRMGNTTARLLQGDTELNTNAQYLHDTDSGGWLACSCCAVRKARLETAGGLESETVESQRRGATKPGKDGAGNDGAGKKVPVRFAMRTGRLNHQEDHSGGPHHCRITRGSASPDRHSGHRPHRGSTSPRHSQPSPRHSRQHHDYDHHGNHESHHEHNHRHSSQSPSRLSSIRMRDFAGPGDESFVRALDEFDHVRAPDAEAASHHRHSRGQSHSPDKVR